ncbi:hypothetical protein EW026_g4164 [Hermanssonia centrifuga]|uniref:Choline transport protein n=1 Tax=Hermanssonia centrifuga TaxID=98765 RepID=A0A4V3XAF6_9APHY|nr:hypothetical protein EW026_g4164 [Hermanssonia centrifuga]
MADIEKLSSFEKAENVATVLVQEYAPVNASGHRDQLDRQYSLLSICATALTIDNAWPVLGGSVAIAKHHAGPPGIIYEFLVACVWYGFLAASLAELASSIPSSGGVYHYGSVTPGTRYGRVLGYYSGSIIWAAWIAATAAAINIPASIIIQMYSLYHPNYVSQGWQIYVVSLIVNWSCVACVIFGNRFLPVIYKVALFVLIAGGLVTVIVLAVLPRTHGTNSSVWVDFENATGYSGGLAFLSGVLNGAFTIGTPESVTHMAEELPEPRKDLPKAIAAQIILGTLTGLVYAVALMYSVSDLTGALATRNAGTFPLAAIYLQAMNNNISATMGLLFIVLLSVWIAGCGCYVTNGRTWWSMSRDGATPFSKFFSRASAKRSCPIEATIFCGIMTSALGAIQAASSTAFSDLAGSFVVLSTISYVIPIAAHLFTGRKNVPIGPFWMAKYGYFVNAMAVLLTILFDIIFCFPYSLPVTTPTMNYTSVIIIGYIILVTIWWFVHGGQYAGPHIPHLEEAGKRVKEVI